MDSSGQRTRQLYYYPYFPVGNWDTEVLKPLTPVSWLGNGGAGTQTLAASPVGSPNALGPLGPWQWRPRGELVYVEFQIPFTSFCLLRGTR